MRALGKDQKVFGIGLSKTGTLSLSAALNLLGIRSIHFPHDDTTFAELQNGTYKLSILSAYQAITDTPVAPFYPQLDQVWPGSKFILTVREKASWLESTKDHWRVLKRDGKRANDVAYQRYVDFINACVYGCTQYNADRFSYAYDHHFAASVDYFANRPDDFLILDICSGASWDKLCAFLGTEKPAGVPFPHVHRNPWLEIAQKTRAGIDSVVPAGSPVIIVDQDGLREYVGCHHRTLPFMERDGAYWGLPQDDDIAIGELERLREQHGARFMALTYPCLWMMDHYARFADHVRSKYACVVASDVLLIFELA